jgi:hypothetical protein
VGFKSSGEGRGRGGGWPVRRRGSHRPRPWSKGAAYRQRRDVRREEDEAGGDGRIRFVCR